MLGVVGELPVPVGEADWQWYYLSAQEPDEVLVVKLFDIAAPGQDAQHADAPWHASPKIGEVEDHPRESIELGVLPFW